MNNPVEDASTSSSQIVVNWSPITSVEDTGADTITYYKLEWDAGTSQTTWTELTTPGVLVTSFT